MEALNPLRRLLRRAASHEVANGLGYAGLPQWLNLQRLVKNNIEEPLERVPRYGLQASEQLVEHHAERVNVDELCNRLSQHLLGRHVIRRAEREPGFGERQVLCLGNAKIH